MRMNTSVEWWKMNKWLCQRTEEPLLCTENTELDPEKFSYASETRLGWLGNVNFEHLRPPQDLLTLRSHCLRTRAHRRRRRHLERRRPPPPPHQARPHPRPPHPHCQSSHLGQIQPGHGEKLVLLLDLENWGTSSFSSSWFSPTLDSSRMLGSRPAAFKWSRRICFESLETKKSSDCLLEPCAPQESTAWRNPYQNYQHHHDEQQHC